MSACRSHLTPHFCACKPLRKSSSNGSSMASARGFVETSAKGIFLSCTLGVCLFRLSLETDREK